MIPLGATPEAPGRILLVLKPEVQPLVPLILSRSKIHQALIVRHGVPFFGLLLVAEFVVPLDQKVQHYVHTIDGEQLAVATDIPGFVVCRKKSTPFAVTRSRNHHFVSGHFYAPSR